MADRTVTARLRLVYDEFTKGTKAAAQGIKGVGDEAKKTSQSAGRDWSALGQSVSDLGSSMTTRLTLPIVGLGVVATKAAGDFDAAFVQMQTLAGVSADEVDGLKESVLGLAGETGKAPQELAEAMFFLQSSGLDAAGAMEALEISAKASAAGLGETQILADAASSVMLAYAESGMTAAEAMDTLVATARAGKAEPAAIATQLSKLIPVAAALDISFQDVGGALAALSTRSFSAEQGATGLAAVMSKLQKPSQQAQEQLDAVGLSGDRLKDILAEEGLLGTLNILKERLGDNGFVRFLEDQEAIRAGTALTTGDLGKLEEIFGQVADSAGATEEAFGTWAESMGADNARAFADFQVALIELGDAIAPLAADLMSFAASVASAFGDLPDWAQKAAIGLLAMVAAAGPLMTAGGKLMSAWGAVTKVFENWTSAGGRAFADAMNNGASASGNLEGSAGRLSGRFGRLSRVVGAAGAAGAVLGLATALDAIDAQQHAEKIAVLAEEFVAMGGDVSREFEELMKIAAPLGQLDDIFGKLLDTNVEAAERFIDTAESLKLAGDQTDDWREQLERKRDADVQATADQAAYNDEVQEGASSLSDAQGAVEGTTEAMADQEQAVNEAAEAHRNYADTIRGAVDPVFGLLDALRGNAQAHRDVVTATAERDKAIEEHGRTSAEAIEAELALQDAIIGVGTSAADVTSAAADLNAAVAENPALVDQALGALQTWRDQGIIPTDEQLVFLQEQIRKTALEGAALDETDPHMEVTESGSRTARERFSQVEHAAERIPSHRNTSVSTSGTSRARQQVQDFVNRLLGIPTSRTVMLNIVSNNLPGASMLGLSGGRATGGPVAGGKLYQVAERGKHELLEAGGDTYLIPGSDGRVIPAGPMTSAASFGGGSTNVINLDMRGAVVASERQFRDMVKRAFNEGNRKGRGFNAA